MTQPCSPRYKYIALVLAQRIVWLNFEAQPCKRGGRFGELLGLGLLKILVMLWKIIV
jgi:hypothetical protein